MHAMNRSRRTRYIKGSECFIGEESCPIDVWCPYAWALVLNAREPQINLIYAEICTATEHSVTNFSRRNCVSYQPGRPKLIRSFFAVSIQLSIINAFFAPIIGLYLDIWNNIASYKLIWHRVNRYEKYDLGVAYKFSEYHP